MKQCKCVCNPFSEPHTPARKKTSLQDPMQKPKEDHMAEDDKSEYKHACRTAGSYHRAGCSEYPSTHKECSSEGRGRQCTLWPRELNMGGSPQNDRCEKMSGRTAEKPGMGEDMLALGCHRGLAEVLKSSHRHNTGQKRWSRGKAGSGHCGRATGTNAAHNGASSHKALSRSEGPNRYPQTAHCPVWTAGSSARCNGADRSSSSSRKVYHTQTYPSPLLTRNIRPSGAMNRTGISDRPGPSMEDKPLRGRSPYTDEFHTGATYHKWTNKLVWHPSNSSSPPPTPSFHSSTSSPSPVQDHTPRTGLDGMSQRTNGSRMTTSSHTANCKRRHHRRSHPAHPKRPYLRRG